MRVGVDTYYRGEAAAAHATHRPDSELEIFGGSRGGQFQFTKEAVEHPGSSAHMASRPEANLYQMPANRFETETVVKGGDVEDFRQGDFKPASYLAQRPFGKVMEPILKSLENWNQIVSAK